MKLHRLHSFLLLFVFAISLILASSPNLRAEDKPGAAKPAVPKSEAAKPVAAKPVAAATEKKDELLPGHSEMGAAFNVGPRQAAYLMGGTGKINFPITTKEKRAREFFEQGIGQLHGFWYFEAERSFRQVASLDPQCAMAFWGMAMANLESDESRAAQFIAKANEKKNGVSRNEKLWIESVNTYLTSKAEVKERRRQLVREFENIVVEFPRDLEAKAFLAWLIWSNSGKGIAISSHLSTDMILAEILKENPLHPGANHYRIHLWDNEKAERALSSAERIGESSPHIAHQWHMAGHIYSKQKSYPEAIWMQEASSRVDHTYMMKDAVPPYQIHNYAHNQQWMISNMLYVGRFREAKEAAKNLIEVPRHPKLNALSDRGSAAAYGRARLYEALEQYEQWQELLDLTDSVYLDATTDKAEQCKRYRARGLAFVALDHPASEQLVLDALGDMLKAEDARSSAANKSVSNVIEKKPGNDIAKVTTKPSGKTETVKSVTAMPAKSVVQDKAKEAKSSDSAKAIQAKVAAANDAGKKTATAITKEVAKTGAKPTKGEKSFQASSLSDQIKKAIAEIKAMQQLRRGYKSEGYEALTKIGGVAKTRLAYAAVQAGKNDKAVEYAQQAVAEQQGQVLPLAMRAYVLHVAGKKTELVNAMADLRKTAIFAEIDLPPFRRLDGAVRDLKLPRDWRDRANAYPFPTHWPDIHTLGSFLWSPQPAIAWSLPNAEGKLVDSSCHRGKPALYVFYLGAGCTHCVEQLRKLEPAVAKFRANGIELFGISTDSAKDLRESIAMRNPKSKTLDFPFTLVSDEKQKFFKEYRAFDDYEKRPLHATILVDADGYVRFRDVSFEPLTDVDFLLAECPRLLKIKMKPNVKRAEMSTSTPAQDKH